MGNFKDPYIARWLLQNTESNNIVWQKNDSGVYFADINDRVRVEIINVPTRTGPQITIKFASSGLGEVCIFEPLRNILSFIKKYDTPDEEELAQLMKRLLSAVSRQHTARVLHEIDTEEERKQSIFCLLLDGNI